MRMLPLIAKFIGSIVAWVIITRLIGAPPTTPISLIILALCVVAAVAINILMKPKSTEIDPRKWSFDPETGEYHQVTLTHNEGSLLDGRTYHKRLTDRLIVISQMKRDRNFAIASAIIFAISFYVFRSLYGSSGTPGASLLSTAIAALSGCGTIALGVSWLRKYISLRTKELDAGPPPVTPQSPEDALNVNDPNDARQPSLTEIEHRLHARARSVDDEPNFSA